MQGEEASMICCAWSPCGAYIVAGNKDCNAYMWHWAVSTATKSHQEQQEDTSAQGVPAAKAAQAMQHTAGQPVAAGGGQHLHVADWPLPMPLPHLQGHSQGVWQVEFSHAGTMLATGSTDGSVRVSNCQ